ncbi:MAG: mechanosensitive ion channel family protein, partial [Bacteroidota bacterium]
MKYLTELIANQTGIELQMAEKLVYSIIVIFLAIVVRWIVVRILSRKVADIRNKYYWIRAAKYSIGVLDVIILIVIWFSEIEHFATFIGLISAALTIALKDMFINMAGWIFILVRKPFQIGDRVQIGEHLGDVIDTRVFQFTINEIGNWVDADQSTGRIIHIPNGKVFTTPQANFNQGFSHIWHEINVLITFESNWKKAKEILTDIVNRHAASLTHAAEQKLMEASQKYMILYNKLTPIVYTKVKDSGVQLSMRFLITPQRRRGTEQAIWEEVLDAFAENSDIHLAYPTQRIFYQPQ